MTTHAKYQHSLTLQVAEYPRDMAAMFPELVEIKPEQKPLAFTPLVVPTPLQATRRNGREAKASK